MAKLYFYYSAMNAGKTTTLLQSAYNYRERGMNALVLKPSIDDRHIATKIRSRIGLESNAISFGSEEDLLGLTDTQPPFAKPLIEGKKLFIKALKDWVEQQHQQVSSPTRASSGQGSDC